MKTNKHSNQKQLLVIVASLGIIGIIVFQIYSYKIFPYNYNQCSVALGHSTSGSGSRRICKSIIGKEFIYLSENDGIIKATINSVIFAALEMYRFDNKNYPDSLKMLVPHYLIKMPLNPRTNRLYFYQANRDKLGYTISTELEDGAIFTFTPPSNLKK